ncbi:hypothetical protein D3C72_2161940 [compost metagenome]
MLDRIDVIDRVIQHLGKGEIACARHVGKRRTGGDHLPLIHCARRCHRGRIVHFVQHRLLAGVKTDSGNFVHWLSPLCRYE